MLLNIMKIFKNLFGNNSKISADEIAVTKDLMVSGAVIVDSSSNTNGNYVKWADGTMVCWAYTEKLGINVPANGEYQFSIKTAQTFVGPFATSINGYPTDNSGLRKYIPLITDIPTGLYDRDIGIAFKNTSSGPITKVLGISYAAIGKWK